MANGSLKIGIVAPLHLSTSIESPFRLELTNGKQLSIKNLHELIRNDYTPDCLPGNDSFIEKEASAAGYYLEGLLRSQGYDTFLSSRVDDESMRIMAGQSPDIICLSATMIMSRKGMIEIVNNIRRHMPDIKIIAGGMYVWKSYIRLNRRTEYDMGEINDSFLFPSTYNELGVNAFVVSLHGMDVLLQLLSRFGKSATLDTEDLPNLALPTGPGGKFEFTRQVDEEVDVNDLYTRWDLVDDIPSRVPIRSGIGCPYRCEYCDFHSLRSKMAVRSKKSLLKELSILRTVFRERRPLVTILAFTDDNIFLNEKRVTDICKTMIESKINKFWGGFIRADRVNENNIDLIKSSGFNMAFCGIETGDPGQIERINKKCNLDEARRGIELLDERAIPILISLLVGFPGETEKTIRNTADYISSMHQTHGYFNWHAYPFVLFPLANVNKKDRRDKFKLSGLGYEWSHYTMDHTEVEKALEDLFRQIEYVPYTYYAESYQFLRRFNIATKRKLYSLRKQMTLDVLQKRSWEPIAGSFEEMSSVFGLGSKRPPDSFRSMLVT